MSFLVKAMNGGESEVREVSLSVTGGRSVFSFRIGPTIKDVHYERRAVPRYLSAVAGVIPALLFLTAPASAAAVPTTGIPQVTCSSTMGEPGGDYCTQQFYCSNHTLWQICYKWLNGLPSRYDNAVGSCES